MPRMRDPQVDRISFVSRGAARDPADPTDTQRHLLWKREDSREPITRAVWTQAQQDALPDSSFAYIASGGKKDDDGKTTPRSLRHLPYRGADGKVDLPHLRNALARLDQTDIPAEAKASAKSRLVAAAKAAGVDTSKAQRNDDNPADPDEDGDTDTTSEDDMTDTTDDTKNAKKDEASDPQTAAPAATATAEPVDKGERVSLTKAEHDALMARIAKSEADAKEAVDVAKAEKDKRVTAEFVAKAEAHPHLPGEYTAIAKAWRDITEHCSPETVAYIDSAFGSLNATVAKSEAFRVIGRGAEPADGSAQGRLNAIAEGIAKAEGVDIQTATAKAAEQNQGLVIEARNEARQTRRAQ